MSDCIFCKLAAREIPRDFVYENANIVAFNDIQPKAPVHVLIIPKKHIATVNDITTGDVGILGELVLAAREVAVKTGIAQGGYRLIVNCGENGGQAVNHLHMHVLGGRKIGPKGEEF